MGTKLAYTTEFCIDRNRLEADMPGETDQVADAVNNLNNQLTGDDYVELERIGETHLKLTVDLAYQMRPDAHFEQVQSLVARLTPYATAAVRIFQEDQEQGESLHIEGPESDQVTATLQAAMETIEEVSVSDNARERAKEIMRYLGRAGFEEAQRL